MTRPIQPESFPEPLQDLAAKVRDGVRLDAEDALGFYPALELRQFARDLGFNIG